MANTKSNKQKEIKKRYWSFILYPESAPHNWIEILKKKGVVCAISPLHDKDINELDNEFKKAHYHILVAYKGPTTFNNVKNLCDELKQPIPQPVESVSGVYRYLTHMDNPEKYQYSANDIRCLNGFNIGDYVQLTKNDIDKIKIELNKLIWDNAILEYSDFIYTLQEREMYNELGVAMSNTIYFNALIRSERHKAEKQEPLIKK